MYSLKLKWQKTSEGFLPRGPRGGSLPRFLQLARLSVEGKELSCLTQIAARAWVITYALLPVQNDA